LINPANTLDGLVARRADDTHEPFQKRYLTEQEAIEGPDDETEAKVRHCFNIELSSRTQALVSRMENRIADCLTGTLFASHQFGYGWVKWISAIFDTNGVHYSVSDDSSGARYLLHNEPQQNEKGTDLIQPTMSPRSYSFYTVSLQSAERRGLSALLHVCCRNVIVVTRADESAYVADSETHGIRVVSKYSRSKAFDQATTNLAERDDEDKPRIFACEPDKEPERQKQLPSVDMAGCEVTRPEPLLPGKTPLSYRCSQCYLEQPGLSVLVHHLRTVHSKCPYECRCRVAFNSIGDALNHATTSSKCSSDDLVLNVTPIYNTRY
ncbi:hypothetical protein OSTOST_13521, partial [Ostertagia ostertagi]